MSPLQRRALHAAPTIAVVALVAASAVGMWTASVARNDALWHGFYHDRNGHFSFALNLAIAIRSLDPVAFFSDLEKAKVWPPVHGLVLSVVLLLGDLDHRLGIVPSLAGWTLTVVCVW